MIKISTEKPSVYEKLREAFGIDWETGVYITYGDTVYCKDGYLPPNVIVHEQVHIDQQKGWNLDEYVDKFINDKQFRFEKEVEAFQAEAKWMRSNIKDRNELHTRLDWMWKKMATHYGDMISYQHAKEII